MDYLLKAYEKLRTPIMYIGIVCFLFDPIIHTLHFMFPNVYLYTGWYAMRLMEGFMIGTGLAAFSRQERQDKEHDEFMKRWKKENAHKLT